MNSRKRRPQFNIATIFGLTLMAAFLSWFLVARSRFYAHVTVLDPGGVVSTDKLQEPAFIDALSKSSDSPLKGLSNARIHEWLGEHLNIKRVDNADIAILMLTGNSFRDDPDIFLPMLHVIVDTLLTDAQQATPKVQLTILSEARMIE